MADLINNSDKKKQSFKNDLLGKWFCDKFLIFGGIQYFPVFYHL